VRHRLQPVGLSGTEGTARVVVCSALGTSAECPGTFVAVMVMLLVEQISGASRP